MPKVAEKAFSLIEVAVAIGIVAILAGAAVPLVLKALNQQREARTRGDLKTCWEALFGSRERTVPNVRSDFGWIVPAANGQYTLGILTTQPGALPRWGTTGNGVPWGATSFQWGWNGPYWNGTVQPAGGTNGLPADAWGRPIRLILAGAGTNRTAILRSYGANGRDDGGTGDDIVYPATPQPLTSFQSSVQVNVNVGQVVSNLWVKATPVATHPSVRYRYRFPQQGAAPWYSGYVPGAATWTNALNTFTLTGPLGIIYPNVMELEITVQNPSGVPLTFTQSQTVQMTPGTRTQITFTFPY